jgi:hypothetical protein
MRVAADDGTDQMSPPDENAISRPSGEMPGSANAADRWR